MDVEPTQFNKSNKIASLPPHAPTCDPTAASVLVEWKALPESAQHPTCCSTFISVCVLQLQLPMT